jgi:hypothetical protein
MSEVISEINVDPHQESDGSPTRIQLAQIQEADSIPNLKTSTSPL